MSARATSLAIAAIIIAVLSGVARATDDEPSFRKISIDAAITVGALRPFSGVQAAAGADGTAFYKAARIDLVRVDAALGPGADAIFPDMGADTDDPKSYNFGPTDRVIGSIKSAGAEPLLRITGEPSAADTPSDLEKYAQIARHMALHYNKGWGKGFKYAVRYWEIWNEPDSKRSWGGAPLDYYVLYDKMARAIQSADDDALVGGPALAKPLLAGAYRENFIDVVRANRLPLDFFSWHFFAVDSNDPFVFVSIARELRRVLDAHGSGSTKNILEEWNVDPATEDMSNAARASFAASALIYMLGGPIDAQTVDARGMPDEVAHALSAFGSLKSTPILIKTVGGDDAGFALAAGRSPDRRLVKILISNYQIAPKYLQPRDNWDTSLPERRSVQYHDNAGYDAEINLPSSGKYKIKRYRIDERSNFTLVDQSIQTGPSVHLRASLPPPGVELIVIGAN
jgi:xylan 1,4-beta-xylosidase